MELSTESKWTLGKKFYSVHPHLESIDALWNKKWKWPCSKSLYPFHDGLFEHFEPIFDALIAKGINSGYTDDYTREFIPTAESIVAKADELYHADPKQAITLYLQACAVYRIARFPYINSDLKRQVYAAQKAAYIKGASLWYCPMTDVEIPHTAGTQSDGPVIPLYVRFPKGGPDKNKPVPTILLLTGLDGHRPDNTTRADEFISRGWATVISDIPGTADCPADRRDPRSAERLWTSVLDWMEAQGTFDMNRVIAWGLSAGGYNAIRIAHTHAKRLAGSVAQGAGSHHFFSREWLEKAQSHEYPWNALPALTEKFGYATPDEFMNNAQETWSLVKNRILLMNSCRLFLVNGTHDGLMPIEDSMLLFEYGRPKEARFYQGLMHMGYPPANGSIYTWLEEVMASVTVAADKEAKPVKASAKQTKA